MLFLNNSVYSQFAGDVFSPIFLANTQQVRSFIGNGGDVNIAKPTGETLLHYSIFFEYNQTTKVLLEAGADINQQDAIGRTAFYWSIILRNQEITKILIERDADLIPNSDGSKRFRPISLTHIVPGKCISDPYQTWINAETHPEFLPYIEKYLSAKEETIAQRTLDYPIKILFYRSDSEVWRHVSSLANRYTLQGTTVCIPNSRHILVNYDAWITLPESTKKLHLLHEFGHCDLNRNHESMTAQSIMSIFYIKQLSLQRIDIDENPSLRQDIYKKLFLTQGDEEFGKKYTEGQAYPVGLKSDDPEVCPVKTRLYLDEVKSE